MNYPRVEFEMSKEQMDAILRACRPTPVLFGSGGVNLGGDPQENANRAWRALGAEMGFDHMTVRPIDGKGMQFFTAVPSETKEAKAERTAREAAAKKAARVAELRKAITDAQAELEQLDVVTK